MPVWLIMTVYFVYEAIGPFVARVLISMGAAAITFTGGMAAFTYVSGQAQSKLLSLPAATLPWVGMLNIDKVITLIISAYAFRAVFKGLSSGATIVMRSAQAPWGAPGGIGGGNDLSA